MSKPAAKPKLKTPPSPATIKTIDEFLGTVEAAVPGGVAIGLGVIAKALGLDKFADGLMGAGMAKMAMHAIPKEEPLITEAKKALEYGAKLKEVTPPTRQLKAKSSAR